MWVFCILQVLVLSVMATLVKYTTTESEVQILYEYLAEASVVFPKVFPIIHSLLDAKINNLLSMCHNKKILASVQAIIQNMVAISFEEEKLQQQLHYLQVKTSNVSGQKIIDLPEGRLFLDTLKKLKAKKNQAFKNSSNFFKKTQANFSKNSSK